MLAKFLVHRLAAAVVVVLGVSVLIFLLARVIPGDPARLALGPTATAEQVASLRQQLGLNLPLIEQYGRFLAGAVRFDFGISLYTNRPVAQDIAEGFSATLELVLFAGVAMAIFGGVMGIASAHFKDRWPDNASRLVSLLCVAMPNFVWALLLMLAFAYALQWLPLSGRLSEDLDAPPTITGLFTVDSLLAGQFDVFADALRHLILPAIALSLPGLAQIARLMRTNMVDSYARPYTEFARAYGISAGAIAFKWALRPALIPTLTIFGMQVVALLGNAFLVESVFRWPGMARYGVEAILRKDLNAIIAVVLVISIFFVIFNLITDAAIGFIDPRIRLRGGR